MKTLCCISASKLALTSVNDVPVSETSTVSELPTGSSRSCNNRQLVLWPVDGKQLHAIDHKRDNNKRKKTATYSSSSSTNNTRITARSCSPLSPVSTGMGDRLRAGIPPWYLTKPTRSTQPCIPLGSLNRVLALIGWGKGGNVTPAGWQVTVCDPIWHVSSRSGAMLVAQTAILFFTFIFYLYLCPGLPKWKGKRNLELPKQETVSGSGINWITCKSAPRSR